MTLLIKAIPLGAVLAIGLLAGVMLGVAMEQQTAQHLAGDCWIIRQNLNDRVFRIVMPTTFALTLLSSLAAVFLMHHSARMWMFAACLMSVIVICITVFLEVPLNNMMVTWGPTDLPVTWQTTRDAWLHNHWLRTGVGIGSFACSGIAICVRDR